MSAISRECQLYVGDLDPSVSEAQLLEFFSKPGPIGLVRVCREPMSRQSLGYGFIHYHQAQDAAKALDTLNHKMITGPNGSGRECRIQYAMKDPSLRKGEGEKTGNLFVRHLPSNMDSAGLHDFFSQYGNLSSCKVMRHPSSQESLKYGFVQYVDPRKAADVKGQLNGTKIGTGAEQNPKPLQLEFYVPKEKRPPTGPAWTNLFVKGIGNASEDELRTIFSGAGEVTSVHVRTGPRSSLRGPEKNNGPAEENVPYGFGFVSFRSHEEAVRAFEKYNNQTVSGRAISCAQAVPQTQRKQEKKQANKEKTASLLAQSPGCNLYIKNLAEDVTTEILAAEAGKYGPIKSCAVMLEKSIFEGSKFIRPGPSKGVAFVCYQQREDAEKARQYMSRSFFHGKSLNVQVALPKQERKRMAEQRLRPPMPMGYQMYPYPPQGLAMRVPQPTAYYQPRTPYTGAQYPGQRQQFQGAPMAAGARSQAGVQQSSNFRGPQGGPQGVGRAPQQQPRGAPQQAQARTAPAAQPYQKAQKSNAPPSQQAKPQATQAAAPEQYSTPSISTQDLSNLEPMARKNYLGQMLYPLVLDMAGTEQGAKVTGMILELDAADVLELTTDRTKLKSKVDEALQVLRNYKKT
jgi:polyadenylate-binding protein